MTSGKFCVVVVPNLLDQVWLPKIGAYGGDLLAGQYVKWSQVRRKKLSLCCFFKIAAENEGIHHATSRNNRAMRAQYAHSMFSQRSCQFFAECLRID